MIQAGMKAYAQTDLDEVEICAGDIVTYDYSESGGVLTIAITTCSAKLDCETGEIFEDTEPYDCHTSYEVYGDTTPGGGGDPGEGCRGCSPGGGGGGTEPPPYTDCQGVSSGSAYPDDCGVCVGGTTGKTAAKWFQDADGDTWGNSAVYKYCYDATAGWVMRGGDYNDGCYNEGNDPLQCADTCAEASRATAYYGDSILRAHHNEIASEGDNYPHVNGGQYMEYGAPVSVAFTSSNYTEDFTYNNILVTEGTSANSWAPSDHWETGDFVVGWEHYHPGIDPDPQDPEDLSWFTDQLAIAQAAGSAAEAFFKKHAVGIVTTEHDVLAVSITNWGIFASHIGAYKLDETGTNLAFEDDKSHGGMAYALLHTYGDCLTLSIAPRSTLVFAPYKLNPAGTGTTTKTCP